MVASESCVPPDVGEGDGCADGWTAVDIGVAFDASVGDGPAPTDWLTHVPVNNASADHQNQPQMNR